VEDLKEGDAIWTMDEAGRRVPASILRTGHMIVPAGHQMVHVTLSDGRELWASPGHPTSDGRTLGEVQRGNTLDGASIVSLEQVPYQEAYTYDILPAGATGLYWANGILMGSTFPSP
jgi:hypothetical protein